MNLKKSFLALLLGSSLALAACSGDEKAAPESEKETTEVDKEPTNENKQQPAEGTDDQATTADAGAGEEVYNKSCLSCHGQQREGGFGPSLEKVGGKYSKDEILEIIQNGKGQMPKDTATGKDAEAVSEWLATLK